MCNKTNNTSSFQIREDEFEEAVKLLERVFNVINMNYSVNKKIVTINVECNSEEEAKEFSETLNSIK